MNKQTQKVNGTGGTVPSVTLVKRTNKAFIRGLQEIARVLEHPLVDVITSGLESDDPVRGFASKRVFKRFKSSSDKRWSSRFLVEDSNEKGDAIVVSGQGIQEMSEPTGLGMGVVDKTIIEELIKNQDIDGLRDLMGAGTEPGLEGKTKAYESRMGTGEKKYIVPGGTLKAALTLGTIRSIDLNAFFDENAITTTVLRHVGGREQELGKLRGVVFAGKYLGPYSELYPDQLTEHQDFLGIKKEGDIILIQMITFCEFVNKDWLYRTAFDMANLIKVLGFEIKNPEKVNIGLKHLADDIVGNIVGVQYGIPIMDGKFMDKLAEKIRWEVIIEILKLMKQGPLKGIHEKVLARISFELDRKGIKTLKDINANIPREAREGAVLILAESERLLDEMEIEDTD